MKIFLEVFYAFVGSLGFGFICNIRGSKIVYAAIGGALSQLAFSLLGFLQISEITQYFFATMVIALYAEIMARVKKAPATVFLVPSIIPLVPGGMMYYSMELCIAGKVEEFSYLIIKTFAVAGALAMGILVVSSINKIFKIALYKKKKKRDKKYLW